MNKWIAEFELEDGDTMPEHMDLEYKGAKIDFHCRPLEQEPFINKPCVSSGVCEHDKNKVLDKLRAEIERQEKWLMDAGYNAYNVDIAFSSIKLVIDRYKAESEKNKYADSN